MYLKFHFDKTEFRLNSTCRFKMALTVSATKIEKSKTLVLVKYVVFLNPVAINTLYACLLACKLLQDMILVRAKLVMDR